MKTLIQAIKDTKFNDIHTPWGTVKYNNDKWNFKFFKENNAPKRVERIRETDLAKKLRKVNLTEDFLKALTKFVKSTKGQRMVSCFGTREIIALMKDFEAPKPSLPLSSKQMRNLFNAAIKAAGVKPEFRNKNIVDYTHLLYNKQLKGELKPSKGLLKDEMRRHTMKLNWIVKRDKNGHPMIKMDGNKLLYDSKSNLPILCYTPKPKGLGQALRMHLLEEHKMSKWDRLNPAPSEAEMKADLFPDYLKKAHEDKREAHLEYVREFLSHLYCKKKPSNDRLRVFSVHENTYLKTNYPALFKEHMFYEKDINKCEEIGEYPFVGIRKSLSNTEIEKELKKFISSERIQHSIDNNNIVAFNVYDKQDNFRIGLKVAA